MSKLEFFDVNLDEIGKEESIGYENKLKIEKGNTVVRILPPWRNGAQFYKPFKQHFNLVDLRPFGLEVDNWYSEPCMGEVTVVQDDGVRSVSQPCPVCKIANKAFSLGQQTKDPDLINLGKRLRAKRQYVSNVVDPADSNKVKFYVYGKKIYDDLSTIFGKFGNVTNPQSGRAVTVTKKEIAGQQFNDYSVMPDDKSDISELWSKLYSSNLHNLDNFPPYNTYDDVQAKLDGVTLHQGASAVSSTADDDLFHAPVSNDLGRDPLDA